MVDMTTSKGSEQILNLRHMIALCKGPIIHSLCHICILFNAFSSKKSDNIELHSHELNAIEAWFHIQLSLTQYLLSPNLILLLRREIETARQLNSNSGVSVKARVTEPSFGEWSYAIMLPEVERDSNLTVLQHLAEVILNQHHLM